jgi:diguanylate cyclase (GGDEF)-like protein
MKHELKKITAVVGFTLLALALFCIWGYFQEKQHLITQIDRQLYAAAVAIPYVLKDDFHNRVADPDSISSEEDQNNIRSLSELNNNLQMKFLYTVVQDGKGDYRLSSSSATNEELEAGEEVRYFTAYPDVSELIKQGFENQQTHFSAPSETYHPAYAPIYSDRRGTYRSVFIPLRSPNGAPYYACADMDITHVATLLRQNFLHNILEFVIFALAISPIIYFYISAVKRKSQEFQQAHQLYLNQSERSVTDPLTKIGNRAKLDNELQSAMRHYRNFAQPFGLLMIDIDHFKPINDQYGHQAGDKVLQQFANILVKHTRSNDIAGRWGGEEFMIILPGTNLNGAYLHAEKLRRIIENSEFEKIKNISASFGVAQPTPDMSLSQLLQCVDEALYTAKEEGRNRTVKYLGG